MLLADLVATSAAVAATRSRKAKVMRSPMRCDWPSRTSVEPVVSYLGGAAAPAPYRPGLARAVSELPDARATPSLTVAEVHQAFERDRRRCPGPARRPRGRPPWPTCSAGRPPTSRHGSGRRHRRAAPGRARRGDAGGAWRRPPSVPARRRTPRRDARRHARSPPPAPRSRGRDALAGDRPGGRPPGAADAGVQRARRRRRDGQGRRRRRSRSTPSSTASGSRCTATATRSSSSPAASTTSPPGCPRWSRWCGALPAERFVLDGEALALTADGRPAAVPGDRRPAPRQDAAGVAVTPYFFDVLHLDGRDLLDSPATSASPRWRRWCRRRTGSAGW